MRKIYLVEDDDGIREILEIVLRSENYEVRSFSTASAFTARDLNVDPDLYLFDVMLPDGSGIDLCHGIKNNVHIKNIPVIIISPHAHLQDIMNSCQPDHFISKPFDIDHMVIGVGDYKFAATLKPGENVMIDNSDFLAAQTYYRHQVPTLFGNNLQMKQECLCIRSVKI